MTVNKQTCIFISFFVMVRQPVLHSHLKFIPLLYLLIK